MRVNFKILNIGNVRIDTKNRKLYSQSSIRLDTEYFWSWLQRSFVQVRWNSLVKVRSLASKILKSTLQSCLCYVNNQGWEKNVNLTLTFKIGRIPDLEKVGIHRLQDYHVCHCSFLTYKIWACVNISHRKSHLYWYFFNFKNGFDIFWICKIYIIYMILASDATFLVSDFRICSLLFALVWNKHTMLSKWKSKFK